MYSSHGSQRYGRNSVCTDRTQAPIRQRDVPRITCTGITPFRINILGIISYRIVSPRECVYFVSFQNVQAAAGDLGRQASTDLRRLVGRGPPSTLSHRFIFQTRLWPRHGTVPEILYIVLKILTLGVYLGVGSGALEVANSFSDNQRDQGQRSMTLIRHDRVYQRIRRGPEAAGLTT